MKKKLSMQKISIWYIGIEKGQYKIKDLMEKTGLQYQFIIQNLKRMGVTSFSGNKVKNVKYWDWQGDEFYLKKEVEKRKKSSELRIKRMTEIVENEENLEEEKTNE